MSAVQAEREAVAAAARAPGRVLVPQWLLVLVLAWPPLVVAAAGYVGTRYVEQLLVEALRYRPPVAVIDENAVIGSLEGTPEVRFREGRAWVESTAATLRARGFIVLDQRRTYAVPPEVQVTP